MRFDVSKKLAIAAVAGCACSAFAQETVSYTAVNSNEGQGNAANEIRTPTLVGGYAVGKIVVNGSLTEVNTSTYASEADIRITTPSGQVLVLNPFTTTGFTGTIVLPTYTFNLATTEADAAGVWTIEFYESYNDGAGADSVWDSISFEFIPPPPPPANDNCGDAIVTVIGATYPGSTLAATNDATASCGTSSANKDVWYSFTAPYAGDFSFTTCNSVGFDTVMSLWDTCGGTEIVCDDDTDFTCSFSTLRSELHRTMAEGESILVRISGYNGAAGDYVLGVSAITPPPPPPANDDCSGAIALNAGADQAFDTTSATDSGIAIASCGLPVTIHGDIWYSYAADCSGTVEINTCGSSFDTVVAVFDSCGGNQVACNDDADVECANSALNSRLTFTATAGTTYIVAVGAYATGVDGAGLISLTCTPDVPTCPADFNGDQFLDFFDYDDYVNCFETGNCPPGKTADFNGDDFVDFFDYDDYVAAFETGC